MRTKKPAENRPSILNTDMGKLLAQLYPREEGKRAAAYSAPAEFEEASTKPNARYVDSADLFAAAWTQMERSDYNAEWMPEIRPQREVCVLYPLHGARADFLWPEQKLIVELDGGQKRFGGGSHNTDEDRDRTNMLTLMGYRVIRFSGDQIIKKPHQCVGAVLLALGYERIMW